MVSNECKKILNLLARSKNVLISGPPGTGKSKVLSEVAYAFENMHDFLPKNQSPKGNSTPMLKHDADIPIPFEPSESTLEKDLSTDVIFPASDKKKRKVFRTVFHQNSSYRDFVTGISPSISSNNQGLNFIVVEGALYRASQYVLSQEEDKAALLIIDEINRGPAVQIFGGAIVAIESDKRKPCIESHSNETQYFEIIDPKTGNLIEYALPENLYILAAMNQADASVEPLDVAFLRRWEPMLLNPSEEVLRKFYGLDKSNTFSLKEDLTDLNDTTKINHLLQASLKAWRVVNKKIALGRGNEYQIGHGVLMSGCNPQTMSMDEVIDSLCMGWSKIRAHIEEVFFGDVQAIANVFNANDPESPFKLEDIEFANIIRSIIHGPQEFNSSNIYSVLKAISKD